MKNKENYRFNKSVNVGKLNTNNNDIKNKENYLNISYEKNIIKRKLEKEEIFEIIGDISTNEFNSICKKNNIDYKTRNLESKERSKSFNKKNLSKFFTSKNKEENYFKNEQNFKEKQFSKSHNDNKSESIKYKLLLSNKNINKNFVEEEMKSISSNKVKICKICLEVENINKSNEIFLSPCMCQGTMKFVHEKCIKKWIPGRYKKFI